MQISINEIVDKSIDDGDIESAVDYSIKHCHSVEEYVLLRVLLICQQEKDNGWKHPVYETYDSAQRLVDIFMQVKLYLRRVEFGLSDENISEVFSFLEKEQISPYMVYDIIHVNYADEGKMQQVFGSYFEKMIKVSEYKEDFYNHARMVRFNDIRIQ